MVRRLQTLDSLRGLAALAVMFGHCLRVFPEFGNRPYAGPASWTGWVLKRTPLGVFVDGHVAVLIFFVLSGLVLSLPFQRHPAPPYPVFIGKRIARLYPPYLAAVFLGGVLDALLARHLPRGDCAWLLTGNWAEPIDADTIWQYGLMLGQRVTLNNPVWSLDYEMRISLLLPLLLLPMRHLGAAGAALCGGVLGVMGVVLLSGAGSGLVQAAGQTAYYGSLFLLGALIATQIGRLRASSAPALSVGLALLAWAIFFLSWRDTLLAFGAAALISAVLMPGPIERFCMTRPARFLGRISYSLYLVHVPVLLCMLAVLHRLLPAGVIVVLAVPAAVGAAMLFHRTVEAPSHRLSRAAGRLTPQCQASAASAPDRTSAAQAAATMPAVPTHVTQDTRK
jgi:peptidoglycan/LPS O-acetylase OafA/YrhL